MNGHKQAKQKEAEELAARLKVRRERREFFTVGNPIAYEQAIDRGDCMKAVGGVVFEEEHDAVSILENGYLPRFWYWDRIAPPGRAYRLTLPGPIDECTRTVNALRVLTVPAPVSRL